SAGPSRLRTSLKTPSNNILIFNESTPRRNCPTPATMTLRIARRRLGFPKSETQEFRSRCPSHNIRAHKSELRAVFLISSRALLESGPQNKARRPRVLMLFRLATVPACQTLKDTALDRQLHGLQPRLLYAKWEAPQLELQLRVY